MRRSALKMFRCWEHLQVLQLSVAQQVRLGQVLQASLLLNVAEEETGRSETWPCPSSQKNTWNGTKGGPQPIVGGTQRVESEPGTHETAVKTGTQPRRKSPNLL